MVKPKDSKNEINKLSKKIKVTALQLKTMRASLKLLKEEAKKVAIAPEKSSNTKKAAVKKSPVKKKSVSTRSKATGK